MAPIRVGIIGLSTAPKIFGPGAWAKYAHLPALRALGDEYEIVALCNSTVESARRSIAGNGLPASTKAYGSLEDLAHDPDVDLVVVSVRVEKHLELSKAALLNKKDVYVEYPAGANVAETEELIRLARESGVRTMVGLQARADALVFKLKEILASGEIGAVVSSNVLASTAVIPADMWMEDLEYYLDISSGGNEFHIFFGHFLDSFIDVLGDFDQVQAILKTVNHTVPIYNDKGEVVNPAHPKTAPDVILVQGTLQSSGAVASIAFRKPHEAVDNVGFRWIITGTKGEVEVTSAETQWQMADPRFRLRVKVGKQSGEAREVDFRAGADDARLSGLDPTPLNTARTYVAFAKGDESRYATFESTLRTKKLLHRILEAAQVKK